MALGRFPEFPDVENKSLDEVVTNIKTWAGNLIRVLEREEDGQAFKVYSVATVSEIVGPEKGWIAYSREDNRYYGYTSTGSVGGWTSIT